MAKAPYARITVSEATLPNGARVIQVLGETFVERGGQLLRVGGEALAGAVTAEVGGALLATASLAVAAMPGVSVSREYAEQIGAAERAQRAEAIANAHGRPIALPTPSPFKNETFVRALPTQAAIDATTAPQPRAGDEPQMHAPIPHAPGMAPPHAGGAAADLASEAYKYVTTAGTKEGAAALAAVNKCMPNEKEFRSFGALKNAMSSTTPVGWEVHHIVEQNQTARFGSEVIQNTANAIALPEDVHAEVSAMSSRKPLAADGIDPKQFPHARDYVRTLPFDEQREFGIKQIREAMDRLHTPQQTRDTIEKELKRLDVPGLCAPQAPPAPQAPDINDVQNAIDAHNQQSSRPLPDARSVANWDGSTRSGTFLDLGNGQVVQHQGAGAYAIADVQRQLGGVQPPIGQYATLQQNGQIQVPQQTQSLGMQLG